MLIAGWVVQQSLNKMKSTVFHPVKQALASAIILACTSFATYAGNSGETPIDIENDILSAVMKLYGLSEQGAIDRFIAEEEATTIYRNIISAQIPGYAGAWFNADTGRLHAASSNPASYELIILLGAVSEKAAWSLNELESVRADILERQPTLAGLWRQMYVDYKTNRLVIGAVPGQTREVERLLSKHSRKIHVYEELHEAQQTADIRGGDGTRNSTWDSQYGGVHPCSIGFSVENGFYTAGHCGRATNQFSSASGTPLGKV